jgi:hypothetical protein
MARLFFIGLLRARFGRSLFRRCGSCFNPTGIHSMRFWKIGGRFELC